MTKEQIAAERQAVECLASLLEQAEKCQMLYERAHMALPEPLRRMLGVNGSAGANERVANPLVIPPPERPPMPPEAQPDWIYIRAKDASPTSIALAILRGKKGPMRPKDVVVSVNEIRPNVLSGSIANIGTRLQGKVIDRTEDGWILIAPDQAGVLHNDLLWGPPSIFIKQELAAQRRDAILHILGVFPKGLQTVQLTETLKACPWVQAPANKDLVKDDIKFLVREGKVRQRGNSRKWELVKRDSGG